MAVSAPVSIRDHPAIFAPGDLMSAHGLAGAAEVAVQPGLQAAHRIPAGRK
jgi:NADH dehydrogenase FAD-containing subunit